MNLALYKRTVDQIMENAERSPREEKILALWNRIDDVRKGFNRESLISNSEGGIGGNDDEDYLGCVEITNDGKIQLQVELGAMVLIDLATLLSADEDRIGFQEEVSHLFNQLHASEC